MLYSSLCSIASSVYPQQVFRKYLLLLIVFSFREGEQIPLRGGAEEMKELKLSFIFMLFLFICDNFMRVRAIREGSYIGRVFSVNIVISLPGCGEMLDVRTSGTMFTMTNILSQKSLLCGA